MYQYNIVTGITMYHIIILYHLYFRGLWNSSLLIKSSSD